MNDTNALVAIRDLAGLVTTNQPLVSVDVTTHEARVLAANQQEAALKGCHEAGHACVAAILGIRVKAADINLRHRGETTLGWNDETQLVFSTESRLNDLIVV